MLFVGYQAVGTPGRALVDGATQMKLFGEEIQVNAEIKVLPGVSGHADCEGLMQWAAAFEEKPRQVFVCHGEETSCEEFAARLQGELQYEAMAPYSGTIYDLKEERFVLKAEGIRVQAQTAKQLKPSSVYQRLVAAGQRLMTVIRHNEGGANKDLAKFIGQINSLCDKWDR